MRKFLLLGALLPIVAFGQYYNCNPDPNGEPWITGDYPELTPEMETKLDAIPKMQSNAAKSAKNVQLPAFVDNSQKNSCLQ